MTLVAGTLAKLLAIFSLPLLLAAVAAYAVHIYLSGGSTVSIIPKKPDQPAWRRQIQAMHRRLKARAALEWARIQAERQGLRRAGGRRG